MRQARLACFGVMTATAMMIVGCSRPLPPGAFADSGKASHLRDELTSGEAVGGSTTTAEPTGFATIKGVFKISGTAPSLPPINVTSDASVCAPGGKLPPDPSLAIGPGGGIGNIAIYLKTKVADKFEHPDYAANKDAQLSGSAGFDQKNCVFLTHVFAMRSSQVVDLMNSDTVSHNTNIPSTDGVEGDNQIIPAGGKYPFRPGGESSSPIKVSCSIHNWMTAYILVRENPYFAVTKPDGSFEIKNVPAGIDLQFQVWHERIGNVQKVKLDGADQTWSRGTLKLKLENDEQRSLDVEIAASEF